MYPISHTMYVGSIPIFHGEIMYDIPLTLLVKKHSHFVPFTPPQMASRDFQVFHVHQFLLSDGTLKADLFKILSLLVWENAAWGTEILGLSET